MSKMTFAQDIIYTIASQPSQPPQIMNFLPSSFLGKFILLEVMFIVLSWFAVKSVIYLWILTGEIEPSKPTFGDKLYGVIFINLCMYFLFDGIVVLNNAVLWILDKMGVF